MNRVLILLLVAFVACSKADTNSKEVGKPTQVTIRFLKWYKSNYAKLNPVALGNYLVTDTSSQFVIDTLKTRSYIELFRGSGFVSPTYLLKRDEFFRAAENKYKVETNVELADEFENDFVLFTQEVDGALEAIDHPEIISEKITGNRSEVKIVVGSHLLFRLVKSDTTWHIDEIENIGMDN